METVGIIPSRSCPLNFSHCCHLQIHKLKNRPLEFECFLCTSSLESETLLEEHINEVHGCQKFYECPDCGELLEVLTKFTSHMSSHNSNMFDASEKELNDFVQKPENILSEDKQLLSKSLNRFSCKECSKTYTNQRNLEKHLKIHEKSQEHNNGKESSTTKTSFYTCNTCQLNFTSKYHLESHMIKHSDQRNFYCEECPKTFKHYSSLHNHKRTHRDAKPFQCTICGERFAFRSTLGAHSLTHAAKKRFECEKCCKAFIKLTYLREHERIHSNVKIFKCNICSKSFTSSSTLACHRRIHESDLSKKFNCQWCNRNFNQKIHLRKHILTHTGEKLYSCEVCLKRFNRNDVLKKHLMRLHQENHVKKIETVLVNTTVPVAVDERAETDLQLQKNLMYMLGDGIRIEITNCNNRSEGS